jgi:hypothetical protein
MPWLYSLPFSITKAVIMSISTRKVPGVYITELAAIPLKKAIIKKKKAATKKTETGKFKARNSGGKGGEGIWR